VPPDTQPHHVARPRALHLLPLWTAIQSQLGGAMNSIFIVGSPEANLAEQVHFGEHCLA
jgi:hypothetical protein